MDADVTPELIEEVEFTQKLRGYDPDEVDHFLERVGATVVALQARVEELSKRAQRAETEVAALRDRPPVVEAPPVAPRELSDEEDVEQATRTLVLAKRTAEAAIAEARQEAATLVADARTRAESLAAEASSEAERLVAEAQSHRDDLLRSAQAEVEAETTAVRERLAAEIASLEQRKTGLLTDTEALEAHVGGYRTQLEHLEGALRGLLDDPDLLRTRPSGVEPSGPSSAFYYTGSNPIVSAADVTPLTGQTDAVPAEAAEAAEPPEFVTPDQITPSVPEAGADGDGPEVGSADPWAPGSWSEVSAVLDQREGGTPFVEEAPDAPGFDDVFEPRAAEERVQRSEEGGEATQAYQLADDRYLRDLDAAVNRAGDSDAAMSAFFDDQSGVGGRRFGRRR